MASAGTDNKRLHGHRARKRFGQHFLTDNAVLEALADALALQRDDWVVEIGPGLGALTKALLARLDELTAVELDRDLADRLRAEAHQGLTVMKADALRLDWSQLLSERSQKARLVGNLPYNISSPLLVMLIDHHHQIQDQHFMLQREVVQRIVSVDGADYSRLGILLQAFYQCDSVFDVAPECFSPPPKVQSAVVRMVTRTQSLVNDASMLSQLLAVAFGQRRKMLRGTLLPWLATRGWHPDSALDIPGTARAQEIPAQTYYRLADALSQLPVRNS